MSAGGFKGNKHTEAFLNLKALELKARPTKVSRSTRKGWKGEQ